jgi:hypothetical protein
VNNATEVSWESPEEGHLRIVAAGSGREGFEALQVRDAIISLSLELCRRHIGRLERTRTRIREGILLTVKYRHKIRRPKTRNQFNVKGPG